MHMNNDGRVKRVWENKLKNMLKVTGNYFVHDFTVNIRNAM